MKIPADALPTIPTRSRGVVVFQRRSNGRVVAAKWPRKRGRPKSPVTRAQVVEWDKAQMFVRYAEGKAYAIAIDWTEGTAFYARDVLISSSYGNFLSWPGWGWRVKLADNIQALLNTITEVPGSIIYRSADRWVALLPGAAGYQITMALDGVTPEWSAPPAAPDVQAELDTVAGTPGDLLLRGASAWGGLALGGDGDVLTVASGAPAWGAAPATSIPALLNGDTSPPGLICTDTGELILAA